MTSTASPAGSALVDLSVETADPLELARELAPLLDEHAPTNEGDVTLACVACR